MAFLNPRLVYQVFTCSSNTTIGTWFCTARHFSRFIIIAFICYQFAFRFSQAITISVWFSSDFNRFAGLGLAFKHLISFRVIKAIFGVSLWKNSFFRKYLGSRRCYTNVQLFWIMFLDSPTVIHETFHLVGLFDFSSDFSEILGFELRQTAIYLFCSYCFGVGHSYVSNV